VAELILQGKTVAQAFAETDYYERVTAATLDGITVSAGIATEGTAYGIAVKEYREWYLNTNHLGGALSANVRSSAARELLTDELRRGLSIENSVNALADSFTGKSSVPLPKALRRVVGDARSSTTITSKMRKDIEDARKYIQGLDGPARGNVQLKNAYTRLVNSAESGKFREIYVKQASQRKLRYVNERIARTEMANSYELSRRRAYDEDPNITAYRVVLSDEHPIVDECDYVADADLYGAGAGVYPLSSGVSVPIHVNCLCTTEPVREDHKNMRYSDERSQDYIKGLSEKDRTRVIGKDTTLNDSKSALAKKGVDVTSNNRVMMPKSLLVTKEGRK
jgi:hypothetical protein